MIVVRCVCSAIPRTFDQIISNMIPKNYGSKDNMDLYSLSVYSPGLKYLKKYRLRCQNTSCRFNNR